MSETTSMETALADLLDRVTALLQDGRHAEADALLRADPPRAALLRPLLPAAGLLAGLGGQGSTPRATALEQGGLVEGEVLGDYRILREIGRGGMGIVYEAEQLSLGRHVALKVLPSASTLDPRQLIRFRTEAQATSLLCHDHVVAVYAVGCERGVHYLAMRYVEGDNLAAWVGAWRKGAMAGSVAYGGADFFRLAARLGREAALALEHAHLLGIVHRDVKPANLLLDRADRLYVTDFGLARVGEGDLTRTGDFIGTLRYVSPEQAAGRHGQVDARSDVYSLGVTLYELLTLRPAFDGHDAVRLLHDVTSAEPASPRSLNRAVPRDLETVVLKAMSKESQARYQTAGELADDLERFLDGRPVAAHRPTATQRAAKWARKHPRAVAAALLVWLTFGVGAAIAAALVYQAGRRTEQAYETSRDQEREARKAYQQAAAGRRQAQAALDELSSEVVDEWLARQPELTARQRAFLERVLAYYEELTRAASGDDEVRAAMAGNYLRVGAIRLRLGHYAQARSAYRRAAEMASEMVAARPGDVRARGWLAAAYNHLGNLHAFLGEPAEAEEAYKQALRHVAWLAADETAAVEHRVGYAVNASNLGGMAMRAGRLAEARSHLWAALELQRRLVLERPAVGRHRADLAGTLTNVAALLILLGRAQEAEMVYGEARALLVRLARESPHDFQPRLGLVSATTKLGHLYATQGRLEEAEHTYRDAKALLTAVAERFPGAVGHQSDLAELRLALGRVLLRRGNLDEAEGLIRETMATSQKFGSPEDAPGPQRALLAEAHEGLGDVARLRSRFDDSAASYEQAVDVWRSLERRRPQQPRHRASLASALRRLGLTLLRGGRLDRSGVAYAEALSVLATLPRQPGRLLDEAACRRGLGEIAEQRGRWGEAARAYGQAASAQRELVDQTPDDLVCRMDLVDTLSREAVAWDRSGNLAAALGVLSLNRGIVQELARAQPRDPRHPSLLGTTLDQMGRVMAKRGDLALACQLYEQALGRQRQALAMRPDFEQARRQAALLTLRLADAQLRRGGHVEAAAALGRLPTEGPAALPDARAAHRLLVGCRAAAAQDDRIGPACRAVIADAYLRQGRNLLRQVASSSDAQNALARALATGADAAARDPALAVEMALSATQAAPRIGRYWNTLGLAHYRAGDLKAAQSALERSMELNDGGNSADWFFLALICHKRGDDEGARRLYDRAVRWMAKVAPKNDELLRFRAEAAARLKVGE